jgi:hypothetical protein
MLKDIPGKQARLFQLAQRVKVLVLAIVLAISKINKPPKCKVKFKFRY